MDKLFITSQFTTWRPRTVKTIITVIGYRHRKIIRRVGEIRLSRRRGDAGYLKMIRDLVYRQPRLRDVIKNKHFVLCQPPVRVL